MQALLWYSQDPSALALLQKKQPSESLLERSLGQFQMFLRSLSKNKLVSYLYLLGLTACGLW